MKLFLQILLSLICAAILGCEGRGMSLEQLENNANLSKQLRVVGGENAADGSVPHIVSIQTISGDGICGGTIIAPEWILTAAHCLIFPKEVMKVVTGTNNKNIPGAEYSVVEKKAHCMHHQQSFTNDIGLLRLDRPIVYNERTKEIQMATKNTLKDGDKLIISGYGKTSKTEKASGILKTLKVDYMDHSNCVKIVGNSMRVHEGHLCSDTRSGQGTCGGDSGGPLTDENKVLVGVINGGKPCAVGKPDLYASVAYYYNWIIDKTNGGAAC